MDSLETLFMNGQPGFDGADRIKFIRYAIDAARKGLPFDKERFLREGVSEEDIRLFTSQFGLLNEAFRVFRSLREE